MAHRSVVVLHISPSAYEAGKERMGVENTVVSFVKQKKASETIPKAGIWINPDKLRD